MPPLGEILRFDLCLMHFDAFLMSQCDGGQRSNLTTTDSPDLLLSFVLNRYFKDRTLTISITRSAHNHLQWRRVRIPVSIIKVRKPPSLYLLLVLTMIQPSRHTEMESGGQRRRGILLSRVLIQSMLPLLVMGYGDTDWC